MMLLDIWPKQRANVKRRRLSKAEREYRARVRKNKTAAAVKASNDHIKADRADRAEQRRANVELTRKNHAEDIVKARRPK